MPELIEAVEPRLLMSTTPGLTAGQKHALKALSAELLVIYAHSNITPAQLQAVATDGKAIADVAHKPSPATVKTLKVDVRKAFADKTLTLAEQSLLTTDVESVLTSAGVPRALSSQTATDVNSVIARSTVTRAEAGVVVTDLTAFLRGFKV